MNVDEIKAAYEPRFRAVLERWRKELGGGEIDAWAGDEYCWGFGLEDAGVDLTLTEEDVRDGSDEKGLSILVEVWGGRDGRMPWTFCPYNYTDRVWAHTLEDFEHRVRLLEEIDVEEIRECLNEEVPVTGGRA